MTTRRRLEAMTTRLMDGGVRSPEAAKRLGIDGADAYRMLFVGELDGGPGRDGMVYFDEASIEAYLERHGYGVVPRSSTGWAETGRDGGGQDVTPESRSPSSTAQSDTDENRRHRDLLAHNPMIPEAGGTGVEVPAVTLRLR
jgi:hypothetical protein